MMFDWNDQDQVGDSIWAEFSGNEDHIVPYPEGSDPNNSNNNSNNTPNNNNTSNNSPTTNNNNFPNYSEKSKQNQNSENKTENDLESWPDLPGLNEGNGDDSLASEYLNDFESDTNLDKVQVQLEGEAEAFGDGNENEGANNINNENNNNSFLDCDWGNIGDFDDFDRLFSNGDSIFGSEMGGNGGPFLSQSSDVINSSTLQSLPLPNLQFSGEQASGQGSSSGQTTEIPAGGNKPEQKDENDNNNNKRSQQKSSRKKPSEKGKNKMTVPPLINNSPNQVPVMHMQPGPTTGFPFPGFGFPGYSFPGILIPGKPASNSYNNDRTESGNPVSVMTPQEKIEKLRRRQQMQALLAIQQQQQQLGRQVCANDNLVPQVSSSPRNRSQNLDSAASSALLDGSTNKGLTPVAATATVQDGFLKDDVFIEETIYHQLQETLAKLDVRVRMCIRDSLLRLAQSAMERQQFNNNTNTNNVNNINNTSDIRSTATNNTINPLSARDETDISRSVPTIRFPTLVEEETGTNRIDRTVAHLLFHNLSEKSASLFNEEAPFSPLSFHSDSEVSGAKGEENHGDEMEVDMK
ncbi:hypothetical protein LUZ60_011182 [Juncus effusus]|nr:hypothetical protein LUZ60_011182 [Juncus effusus]